MAKASIREGQSLAGSSVLAGVRVIFVAAGLAGLALFLLAGMGRTAVQAQETTPQSPRTTAITVTATVPATVTATITATMTATATATASITATATITATPSTTETIVASQVAGPTSTPTPPPGPPVILPPVDTQILTGTILANRTHVTVTFFLEGRVYLLPPFRATGVELRRAFSALSLFNCEVGSQRPESECFWDPYPVRRNGFYEIVNGAEADMPVTLVLKDAAPPPENQAWIQNRTGHRERLFYGEALYELENGMVLELTLDPDRPDEAQQVYLRHCIGVADQVACEWLPQPVQGGVYYALTDETRPGPLPDSAVTRIRLEPLLAPSPPAGATPTPTPTPEPTGVTCQIQVPRLNVRAGPGTGYLVLTQIGQDDPNQGRFTVVGRNEDNTWLAVDPAIAPGGWVINASQFVVCQGDTAALPIAPITDGRLAPTPVPTPTPAGEEAGEPTPEASLEAAPGIPAGMALLIATNAFDHPIRFTLDAREHGLPEGTPSEHDLQPGQSMRFLIRAGRVRFTASTPFRGASGNAEFILREGETRELFLHFAPSEEDPSRWELRY